MPSLDATLYALTELRARNLASNSIERSLRAIAVLEAVISANDINLPARMLEGRLLDLHEVDLLVRLCRLPQEVLLQQLQPAQPAGSGVVTSLEKVRMSGKRVALPEVASETASNRLREIRDYLSWQASNRLLTMNPSSDAYVALVRQAEWLRNAIDARLPTTGDRSTLSQREGLASEDSARLLDVIQLGYADNPWKGSHAQMRNQLIVLWMYYLGLRRGELLNVKVEDVDFRQEQVTVVRRADDPEDPRAQQPNAKTRDRVIPMSPTLCLMTQQYVIEMRRHIGAASKHPYLFVADRTGKPMTLSTLNKCFDQLRKACPDLPQDLSPHVLRHTWNDNFSEAMDKAAIQEVQEQQMRSYLMGWAPTSKTASVYTRRHTKRKAREVSLGLQMRSMPGEGDNADI